MPITVGVLTIIAGAIVLHFLRKDKKGAKNVVDVNTSKSSSPAASSAAEPDALVNKPTSTSTDPPRTLQDPNEKYQLPLIEKHELSHDTFRYRFGLPSDKHVLGLPIGQHVHLIATIAGELVLRAYTPVSSDDDRGYVDLVIKVYKRNTHPRFPDGGKMSQFVDALQIGDTIAFRGPSGKLQYSGDGQFAIKKLRKDPAVPVRATHVNMISGGTGITPMLQLVREVLKRPADETKMALLFANQVHCLVAMMVRAR